MKKPVVFDLGNVVLYFDIRKAAERMAPHTAAPLEQIIDVLWTSPHGVAFEEGRLTPQEFYDGARERLGLTMDFGRFAEAWNDIFTENREVISLLRDLAPKYRLYLFSNTNRLHYEYIRQRYDFTGLLDGANLSYEIGARKPAREAFEQALGLVNAGAGSGTKPREVFFTDDRPDHIARAREVGFEAVLFDSASQVERAIFAWDAATAPHPAHR
ncbi:MAG: HAD family phosphatase, partial [bacterium]